jgi:hypothetical protein
MPDGRGARIALEAAFLVAVAAVLGVAAVEPAWIVLVMLLAWVIVALLEWAAWREEPHWASGAPPRYHVPYQPLPPRPPSEELPAFSSYPKPAPRESESPTWIATPELRGELLGWPAVQPEEQPAGGELPVELPAKAAGVAVERELDEPGWPVDAEPAAVADRWVVEELPVLAEPEPVEPESVGPEPETQPDTRPQPLPFVVRLARHSVDPFAEPPAGRRPWRKQEEAPLAAAELPVLPRHARLPARELEEPVR